MNSWQSYWQSLPKASSTEKPQTRVGRVTAGVPIDDEIWLQTVRKIITKLQLSSSNHVLDLAGGNALFSRHLNDHTGLVVCADISHSLLLESQNQRVEPVECDIRSLPFLSNAFDCIVFYAAAQYLSESELLSLLKCCSRILNEDGRLYVGDIPDIDYRFSYFSNMERRARYFNELGSQRPLIGTWFSRDWFQFALEFAGFKNIQITNQDDYEPYSHFRFDASAEVDKNTIRG